MIILLLLLSGKLETERTWYSLLFTCWKKLNFYSRWSAFFTYFNPWVARPVWLCKQIKLFISWMMKLRECPFYAYFFSYVLYSVLIEDSYIFIFCFNISVFFNEILNKLDIEEYITNIQYQEEFLLIKALMSWFNWLTSQRIYSLQLMINVFDKSDISIWMLFIIKQENFYFLFHSFFSVSSFSFLSSSS